MTTRRGALSALLGLAFMAAGLATTTDAEAARKRRPVAKKPANPARTAGEPTKIAGKIVDVSSIIMILEGEKFRILSEDEPHARRTPASVTKLLTLCLIFDALEAGTLKTTDYVTISGKGKTVGGTMLNVRAGEEITVSDVILSLVTKSANDVALSIAEHMAGSEAGFAVLMNKKARDIGMVDSHFTNPHGMRDDNHYSCAYDLALLARHLVTHHANHYHYFSTGSFIFRGQTYRNHNGLMREYEGMDGLKTGMTNEGWQLAASVVRTRPADPESSRPEVDQRVIGIFLGGATKTQRNNCLGYLLDQGYISEGHEIGPSKFRYSEQGCTSQRNAPPKMSLK